MADPEKIVWKQFNQIPDNDWGNEIARDCYIGKVYQVDALRNSWNWSTSITYESYRAYQYDFENAKAVAETRRQRGTSFRIITDPCLVITGKNEAICIADVENRFLENNFLENKEQHEKIKTLKEVAKAVSLIGRIYYYITTPLLVEKPGDGYMTWDSYFDGGWMSFYPGDPRSLTGLERILELQKKAWKLILK